MPNSPSYFHPIRIQNSKSLIKAILTWEKQKRFATVSVMSLVISNNIGGKHYWNHSVISILVFWQMDWKQQVLSLFDVSLSGTSLKAIWKRFKRNSLRFNSNQNGTRLLLLVQLIAFQRLLLFTFRQKYKQT